MIRGGFPNIGLQTFYVSREESNCPLITEIVKLGKKLSDAGILDEGETATISLGYGKRVLINGVIEDFAKIKQEELIEVVDYDPLKNTLLVIGPADPLPETSVHWMIHHARNEVNVVVQINEKKLAEKLKDNLPVADDKYPISSIESIKNVLKTLRDSKTIIIKNHGLLFVGSSIKEIEEMLSKTFEVKK